MDIKGEQEEKKIPKDANNHTRKALMGLGAIILLVVVIVIVLKLLTFGKNVSTDQKEMKNAGSSDALKQALRDIPEEANAGIVKTNELSCNSKEVIDYNIVVVECDTNNKKIIEKFGSKKLYYVYKKSDNEDGFEHFISKNKNTAIENMR